MSESPHLHRTDEGGVAVLSLDVPGEPANTLTERTFAELRAHAEAVGADPTVVGAVLTSGKPGTFSSGADVDRLPELRSAPDPMAALEAAHEAISAVVTSPKPFVAALRGATLGGGLELALACHERLAAAPGETRFALPEVRLGLLPGAGGTQYLPAVLPLPLALEHLLTGKTMYLARARAAGLVDDAVPPNQLRRLARERVRELAAAGPARWRPRVEPPAGAELEEVLDGARALARRTTRGLYPAPEVILDVVATGLREGIEAGLHAEREAFLSLLGTPEAEAAIHLFVAAQAARRRAEGTTRGVAAARRQAARPASGPSPGAVRKVFVLGGGMMGSGIATLAVDHGLDARVRDVDGDALAGVHRYADRALRRAYGKRAAAFEYLYRERFHRLSTTTGLDGIGTADIVVEAVFEDAALKAEVLAEAEARMRPGAVLATNTSAIPISRLAKACRHAERLVGVHFFLPAERMPLVEIIPHAGTDDQALATALGLARQLDRTPVVVADCPGFYTSRVFGRWLAEGARLLLDGVPVEEVDNAAEALGFAVGPLTAYDEVSLDLALKVAGDPEFSSLSARTLDGEQVRAALAALVQAGHRGRKAGLGFYRYPEGERAGPAAGVWRIALAAAGARGRGGQPGEEERRNRLLYAFVREAFACFDDAVIASAADGDAAAVLGIGFPPNLGGPFLHVDQVGASEVVGILEALDERVGGFGVPATLRRLALSGGRGADLTSRPAT